jgi:alkanesulfonate monooxygenase SsuD/methylene tetrahydromethanopterin reductase-like flavin-dependent oxidoreductase (luciferase family)
VRTAAEEIGRDPDEIVYSNALVLCCAEDEAGLARRAAAIGREVDELRENGLAGTPEEVVERIKGYEALGAQRIYLQVLDLSDLEHLRLVAAEVLPRLG